MSRLHHTTWSALLFAAAGMLTVVVPAALAQTGGKDHATPAATDDQAAANQTMTAPATDADAAAAGLELEQLEATLASLQRQASEPDAAVGQTVARRWLALARDAARLSARLPEPADQWRAAVIELRACHHLATHTHLKLPGNIEPAELLRFAALRARWVEQPDARVVGDYWLLQARLLAADPNAPLATRQAAAVEALETFLDEHPQPDSPQARELYRHAARALLAVRDQLGQSDAIVRQLDALQQKDAKANPFTEAEVSELEHRYAAHRLVGSIFTATLRTAAGRQWDATRMRGRPLLIEFFAVGQTPTRGSRLKPAAGTETWTAESMRLAAGGEILRVELPPIDGDDTARIDPATVDGTLYQETEDTVRLSELLRITATPRFVLIDEDGRILAIASTPAITRHLAK